MQVKLNPLLERYVSDQVKGGRYADESDLIRTAVAKMILADHNLEYTPEEIAAAHEPGLPDHEKVLEEMLSRHVPKL
ncbi:MAG: hypothetical protein QM770_21380 [Tepidisphaeraceae bacterium]